MSIQYDALNAAFAMLRTMREQFLNGVITKAELDAAEVKIKADIRVLLGFPAPEL